MKFLQGMMALWLAAAARGFGDQHHASPQTIAAARATIERLIAASGAQVSVAWRPLDVPASRRSEQILIRPDTRFHAASTMKVPVMIELFRQAAARRVRLDSSLVVTNRFHSIVDRSSYELSAADDSDDATYKAIGKPMTLRALCEAMITVSSNLAANTLIEKLGPRNIQATTRRLGASGMQVLRGVEDQKAFDKGLNNTTTANALLTLFSALGHGTVVSKTASADMVAILKRQVLNDAIPAGLPPGTVVAHKTGSITKIHHDAGIVYGRRPYVLVVLVGGIQDQKVSARLIANIASIVNKLQ